MLLDILEPVNHAAADLAVAWPLPEPPPALQSARAELPPAGQLDLMKVGHSAHLPFSTAGLASIQARTLSTVCSLGERPRRSSRTKPVSPIAERPRSLAFMPDRER